MSKLSSFLITVFLFAGRIARADETAETIDQKLATLKFEEKQAEVMIKKMLKRGRIDEEQAGRAKREIASVKEEDVQNIRVEALERIKASKSLATK